MQCVLIADGEGFRGDAGSEEIATVVDEDAGGTVGWGVEGYLDLDAATRAEEVNALVWDQLRAASEDRLSAGEIENC